MAAITLFPYEYVCWQPDKGVATDAISCLSPEPGALLSSGNKPLSKNIALHCVSKPNDALSMWTASKGKRSIKGANDKHTTHILSMATDERWTGLFTARDSGHSVGFALVEHDSTKAHHTSRKPTSYYKEVQSLLSSIRDEYLRESLNAENPWTVCGSKLRALPNGHHIVAALVRPTAQSRAFLIAGHLDATSSENNSTWRKWEVPDLFTVHPCIWISQDGEYIGLARFTMRSPIEPSISVTMPSVPLALRAFERVTMSQETTTTTNAQGSPRCVIFNELIFALNKPSTSERMFQSQSFTSPSLSATDDTLHTPCRVHVDIPHGQSPLYTAIITSAGTSFLLHISPSVDPTRLVAQCHQLRECPTSVATLSVAHPQRPEGARLTVAISASFEISVYEVFGEEVPSSIAGDSGNQSRVELHMPVGVRPSKKFNIGAGTTPRIVNLSGVELLCTNGVLGVFLRPTHVTLPEEPPLNKYCGAAPAYGEEASVSELPHALMQLADVITKGLGCEAVSEFFFRKIVPRVKLVGSSQQDVFLVQRLFASLMEVASPRTEREWQLLWALTRVVQRILSNRTRENNVMYTDQFFIQLASRYMSGAPKGKAKMMLQSLSQVVSGELANYLVTPSKGGNTTALTYVLEGLNSGIPLCLFAEEVIRRFVYTTTLSNGACAIQPREANTESLIYSVGLVLLASCLDVPVYLETSSDSALRCTVQQSETSCIHVPVQGFKDQASFDYALVLAGDLLAVQAPGSPLPLDIAFLAFGVPSRSHCIAAFAQLLSPALAEAVRDISPLSQNTAWINVCLEVLRLPPDDFFRYQMARPPSSIRVASTLCYIMCTSGGMLDRSALASVKSSVSEELCVSSVVSFIFTVTDKMLSAQKNYSSAVMKYLIGCAEGGKSHTSESLLLCRERLLASIIHAGEMWGQAVKDLPYSVRDIANSYRVSVSQSLSSEGGADNTAMSCMLVLCFRAFVLVYYSHLMEQRLDRALDLCRKSSNVDATFTEYSPSVDGSLQGLHAINVTDSNGLPREWFHWKLLDMVSIAKSLCRNQQDTPWLVFFTKVLDLAGAEATSLAQLKEKHYALRDDLVSMSPQHLEGSDGSTVRKYIDKAESLARTFSANDTNKNTYFSLSHVRNPSTVPPWQFYREQNDSEHYLANNWIDRLWAVERSEGPLHDAIEVVIGRITEQSDQTSTENAKPISTALRRPLYDAICGIVPPIRSHAVPLEPLVCAADSQAPRLAAPPVAVASLHGEGVSAVSRPVIVSSDTQSPSKELTKTPPPSAPIKEAATTQLPITQHVATVSQAAPLLQKQSTILATASEKVAVPSVIAQTAPLDRSNTQPSNPETAPVAAWDKYTPQDVAWWEDAVPPTGRASSPRKESPTTEDAALSDTATSYTTDTSQHTRDNAGLDEARQYRDPERCQGASANRGPCHHRGKDSSERKHCHCHCHGHNHSQCRHSRHNRSSNGIDMQLSEAPRSRGWNNIQLLQFTKGLQPPEEPSYHVAHSSRPRSALLRAPTYAKARDAPYSHFHAQDTNGEIALLSFGKAASQPKVHMFAPIGASEKNIPANPPACGPSHGYISATGRTSVRYLDPPPLPASNVFQSPPPLLHLHRATSSPGPATQPAAPSATPSVSYPGQDVTTASTTGYTQQPQMPQNTVSPFIGGTQVTITPTDNNPYAQVPREMSFVPLQQLSQPNAHSQPQPSPSQQTAAINPAGPHPVSIAESSSWQVPRGTGVAVTQSVLSPSEMADFRRYTDDLLVSQGTARSNPISIPIPANSFPSTSSAAPQPGLATGQGSPQPVAVGLDAIARQQSDFMTKVESTLRLKEAEDKNAHQRIMDAVRSMPATRGGLSVVEQSNLLQSTIQQKNELLHLNQSLLDMQLEAARRGASSTINVAHRAVSPLSVAAPPALIVGTQTSPVVGRDASVWAVPTVTTPPRVEPSVDPRAARSIDNTLNDLHRFNAELCSMNTSAEAMERAIQETRDAIKLYEGRRSLEHSSAESTAFLDALRTRTAAAENRLAELNSISGAPTPPASATAPAITGSYGQPASSPKSVWDSHHSARSVAEVPHGRKFSAVSVSCLDGAGVGGTRTEISECPPAVYDKPNNSPVVSGDRKLSSGDSAAAVTKQHVPQWDPTCTSLRQKRTSQSASHGIEGSIYMTSTSGPLSEVMSSNSQAIPHKKHPQAPELGAAKSEAPTAKVLNAPKDLGALYRTAVRRPSEKFNPPQLQPHRRGTRSPSVSFHLKPPTPQKAPQQKKGAPSVGEDRFAMYRSHSTTGGSKPPPTPTSIRKDKARAVPALSVASVAQPVAGSSYETRQQSRRDTNIARRIVELEKEFSY